MAYTSLLTMYVLLLYVWTFTSGQFTQKKYAKMRIDNTSVLTYKHIYSNLLKNPKMNATEDALRRRNIDI